MYSRDVRRRTLAVLESGLSLNRVSIATGISRSAIRSWRDDPERATMTRPTACPRCADRCLDRRAYAELLGWYLGDGNLVRFPNGTYLLCVVNDARYVNDISRISALIGAVKPEAKTHEQRRPGAVVVRSYWKHWPCVFPQHGPGRKHERPIVLAEWQQTIVDEHPEDLLRGLFKSDGCRVVNWTVRRLQSGPKRYEYPRYHFSNASEDIMTICANALKQVGVSWTRPRARDLSVARRADVALLDEFIGPKS
jgi:hypothetical protein